ncbi:MAG TPA: ankyrin repeat domain-containing protein, partial [Solirubrobacterales bacterium]
MGRGPRGGGADRARDVAGAGGADARSDRRRDDLERFLTAAQNNDAPRLTKFLTEHPFLATMHSADGQTGLHAAALSAALDTAKILISGGAEVNAVDSQGQTPLFTTLLFGSPNSLPVIELLVAHGANVNQTDELGDLPVHIALAMGNHEAVLYLAAHGARDETSPVFESLVGGNIADLQSLLEKD